MPHVLFDVMSTVNEHRSFLRVFLEFSCTVKEHRSFLRVFLEFLKMIPEVEVVFGAIKAVVEKQLGAELLKPKPMAMAIAAVLVIPTSMAAMDLAMEAMDLARQTRSDVHVIAESAVKILERMDRNEERMQRGEESSVKIVERMDRMEERMQRLERMSLYYGLKKEVEAMTFGNFGRNTGNIRAIVEGIAFAQRHAAVYPAPATAPATATGADN